jgi:hypothetical protein
MFFRCLGCFFFGFLFVFCGEASVDLHRLQLELLSRIRGGMPLVEKQSLYHQVNELGGRIFSDLKVLGVVEVKQGDNLDRLCRRYGIGKGWWMSLNGLDRPDRIYIGQKLYFPRGDVLVHVLRSRFECRLSCSGKIFRVFPVGLGAEGKSTPDVDTVMSSSRMLFPTYTDRETGLTYPYGHKLNPVGTRWMGLGIGDGYGIHGTREDHSIGRLMSKGCVRMLQKDLEELYDLTLPGDQVLITED